ncbi:hypothetical protein QTP70_009793 [Hemibagrus guttatus]|uniref:CASAMP N-terminal domain-containing protein n=1 Tax=Hemibagrus guttatus TaxID=175788 RepID=A0AAE0UPP3_9TELE|nr:hypothetical protein QTP70_009793 [Hemibagrus guttatus]KAK3534128.1 hypothetical protein QTP86_002256 [Hemibagrus guttatus]
MEDAGVSKHNRRTFVVPAIKSFDHYDFTRAKIACSLTWLVAKAFGSVLSVSALVASPCFFAFGSVISSRTLPAVTEGLAQTEQIQREASARRTFHTCTIESILMKSITAWFGNSTKQDRRALQRVVRLQLSIPSALSSLTCSPSV